MITKTHTIQLSAVERSQLEQKRLAIDVWQEGRIKDALLIVDLVLGEEPAPHVFAECCIAQSAFRADDGDFTGSWNSLENAAPFLDLLDAELRASFYLQRARVHKERGNFDAALTDYSGAETYWNECGKPEKAGAAVLNLAGCYLSLGDPTMAHGHITRAKAIFHRVGSFYISQAYDTEAKIFLAEGKLEQAAQSIGSAIDLVGDSNDTWRAGFLATKVQIEERLIEAFGVKNLKVFDRLCARIKIRMVRKALEASDRSPEGASKLLGLTRHAIESFIDNHPEELEDYRKPRRVRYKTIITKT